MTCKAIRQEFLIKHPFAIWTARPSPRLQQDRMPNNSFCFSPSSTINLVGSSNAFFLTCASGSYCFSFCFYALPCTALGCQPFRWNAVLKRFIRAGDGVQVPSSADLFLYIYFLWMLLQKLLRDLGAFMGNISSSETVNCFFLSWFSQWNYPQYDYWDKDSFTASTQNL